MSTIDFSALINSLKKEGVKEVTITLKFAEGATPNLSDKEVTEIQEPPKAKEIPPEMLLGDL